MNDRGHPPDVTVHSVTLVIHAVSDFIYRRVYLMLKASCSGGSRISQI